MVKCESCGNDVTEVCRDGYCRKCHVDLSFEDCMDGTYTANILKKGGMPLEYIKRAYPNARV